MRIAVANWTDRVAGGAEMYLSILLPELQRAGVELAFWSELSAPSDRSPILAGDAPAWVAGDLGHTESIRALAEWRPDLIFSNGFTSTSIEAEILALAPTIYYAHNHNGTCITGSKTNHRPRVEPCGRKFGPGCILQFYPRRCGGRSPITMLKLYRLQTRRLELLHEYDSVLCASRYMQDELVRHGLDAERVRLAPYPVPRPHDLPNVSSPQAPQGYEPWRIVFAGRLEAEKGSDILLEALPMIRASVGRPIEVIVAGDGRERQGIEAAAADLAANDAGLRFAFTGWLDKAAMTQLLANVHLLAFPSVWPEPFGIIGVEAGHAGVPAAAFDVGGISDWLSDGVNGALAPGGPPTADGFAAAVARCLDPGRYPELARGAVQLAQRFSMERHLDHFWDAVSRAVKQPVTTPHPTS